MSSDLPGEPGSGSGALSPAEPPREALEELWERAEQRALLYLKSLHLHPRRSLELALESLRVAERGPGGRPVADTMSVLRSILHRQGILQGPPWAGLLANGKPLPDVQVAPPIHRGTMVPMELDRRPWLTFLEKSWKGARSLAARLLPGGRTRAKSADGPAAGTGQTRGPP